MTEKMTVAQVLGRAIQKEIESQELYTRLGRTAQDAAAREMLGQMSRVEKKHEELLRRYLRGELGEGSLAHGDVLDYHIAEHLEEPSLDPDMKLDEILLAAANREKASHDFYHDLAGAHPSGEVRKLLEELAEQELEHKQRVEHLYTEVAFPQTDGG